jgi:hypothetical protein
MAAKPMMEKSPTGNRLLRPAAVISVPPTPEKRTGPAERCRSAFISAAPSRSPDSSAATRKISSSPGGNSPGDLGDAVIIGPSHRRRRR